MPKRIKWICAEIIGQEEKPTFVCSSTPRSRGNQAQPPLQPDALDVNVSDDARHLITRPPPLLRAPSARHSTLFVCVCAPHQISGHFFFLTDFISEVFFLSAAARGELSWALFDRFSIRFSFLRFFLVLFEEFKFRFFEILFEIFTIFLELNFIF